MNLKTLKILVWVFMILAVVVLMAGFTVTNNLDTQMPYMVTAILLYGTGKGINIYVGRQIKKDDSNIEEEKEEA